MVISNPLVDVNCLKNNITCKLYIESNIITYFKI